MVSDECEGSTVQIVMEFSDSNTKESASFSTCA